MSKREWRLFLEDILESIQKIEQYVKGFNFEDFEKDDKSVDAVIRNFEIIGEAAKNIPPTIRNKYQSIYWQGVIGLRNRVIHDYFGVDLKIVWQILKKNLPDLKDQVKDIIENADSGEI